MRTLAWRILREFIEAGHADADTSLRAWFLRTESAKWGSFADVRNEFKSADQVGNKLIFNIGGNRYRLIARVSYPYQRISVKRIGTHAEYDRLNSKEIENL